MTATATGLQADVLILGDGSRIVGNIEQITATEALMSNTFAGDLSVPRDTIASIETTAPVTVQLSDGAYLTGPLQTADAGAVAIQVDEVGSRAIPLAGIAGIYREDPQVLQQRALAVKVTANANVGMSLTSGNTDTENLRLDGQVVTRTPRNRYTLAGQYNEEEAENVLVTQNWSGLVKYDHFVSERWFLFNSATFESDEFADLDLRAALAAGMGYQFFETDERSLSIELGPSYVDENFDVAPDDSYAAARWSMNYEQRLLDNVTFFHFNEGLQGLENTDDLTIRSRTGVRLSISERIIARIQTAIDWDNSPPADTDSTDFEHSLSVGYRF